MINFLNQVVSGEVQGGTTAAQLPDVPCVKVLFKAQADNAGNVYLGGANVTVPDGVTDQTSGLTLDAGEQTDWIQIDNLNRFWMITTNNGDDLSYIVLK